MTFEQSFRNGKMDQVAERRWGSTRLRKGVWEGAIVPRFAFLPPCTFQAFPLGPLGYAHSASLSLSPGHH